MSGGGAGGGRGAFFGGLFGAGASGRGGRGDFDINDLTFFDELFRGALPGGGRARTGTVVTGGLVGGAGLAALGPGGLAASSAALTTGLTSLMGVVTVLATTLGGLGDAIGGDKEAFDELDATSQKFVQHVRGFQPAFEGLQQMMRDIALPAFAEAMDTALNERTFGALTNGLKAITESVGEAAKEWGEWIGSEDFGVRLENILTASAGWTSDWSDTLMSLADALMVVLDAGRPFLNWVTDGIAAGAEWLDTWVRAKEETGELGQALDGTKDEVRLIGDLIGALAEVAFNLGAILKPLGEEIMADLADVLERLAEWLAVNREEIADHLIDAYEGLKSVIETLWPIFLDLADAILAVIDAMGGFDVAMQVILGGALAKAVIGLAGAFTGFLIPALEGVGVAITTSGLLTLGATIGGIVAGLAGLAAIITSPDAGGGFSGGSGRADKYPKTYWVVMNWEKASAKERTIVKSRLNGRSFDDAKESDLQKAEADLNKIGSTAGGRPDEGTRGQNAGVTQLPTDWTRPGLGHTGGVTGGQPLEKAFGSAVGPRDIGPWKAGQTIGAPEDGVVLKVGSADGGGSVWFWGRETGNVYWIGHIDVLRGIGPGTMLKRGQAFARTSPIGNPHVHIDKTTGSYTLAQAQAGAGGGTVATTPPSVRGEPPPWDPDDSTAKQPPAYDPLAKRPRLAEQLERQDIPLSQQIAARRAAIAYVKSQLPKLKPKDKAEARAAIREWVQELNTLILREVQMGVENADLTPGLKDDVKSRRGGIKQLQALLPSVDDPELKLQIKRLIQQWRDEIKDLIDDMPISGPAQKALKGSFNDLVADFKEFPLSMRKALVEGIRELQLLWKELLVGGITKEERRRFKEAMREWRVDAQAELKRFRAALAAQFEDTARDLVASFFDAFDAATRAHRTPTEALIDSLNDQRSEAALQRAVDEARKRLEEAMKGTVPGDPAGMMQEIVGRYKMARNVEIAQLFTMGADTDMSGLTDDLLREMQEAIDAAKPVVDQEEVKNAQQALEDALFEQRMYYLEKQAEEEREAYEKQRAEQRLQLELALQMWTTFYSMMIMTGQMSVTEGLTGMLKVINDLLAGMGLPPIKLPDNTPDGTVPLPPPVPTPPTPPPSGGGGGGGGGFKSMAAGGVLTRRMWLEAGEIGPELITPLPVNWREMQAGMLHGDGGGEATVYIDGKGDSTLEAVLREMVDIRVVRNSRAISQRIGARADMRAREGRV